MSFLQRVVFDTSTLVSAALRVGSTPHQALAHALSIGDICVSASTLAELDRVLMRPKFDRYQPVGVRGEFVAFVRQRGVLFSVPDTVVSNVFPPCSDPKDNQFLALILVCEADVLISSDADLLILHPWHEVPILTPGAFLESVSN